MSKKVIEQEQRWDVIVTHLYDVIQLEECGMIEIEKSKATEVAKAIDERYQKIEDALRECETTLIKIRNDKNTGIIPTQSFLNKINQAINQ